jgi:hypothetical protein
MARFDHVDSAIGIVRAPINANFAEADFDKVIPVGINGTGKAEIVKKAFFGPVTPEVPASILQMHPDFILVGDEEALSLI